MAKQISEILGSISSEILSEDVKTSISQVFNEAINEKVKEKLDLEINNALLKLDEDHSQKLKTLIEAIDEDHSNKFKLVLEAVNKDHTSKLQKIVEKYENEITEGASNLKNELTQKLDKFLDVYLEKAIPQDHLKEAVENIRSKKIVDQIKQLVSIDEEFVKSNIKEALVDGKGKIDSLNENLNKKIEENLNLSKELNNLKASMLLEKKTAGLSDSKKKLVYKLLEGKQTEDIEKNFSYVIEMIEKDELDTRETLKESATSKSKVLNEKIDNPVKTEVKNDVQEDSEIGSYVDYLKFSTKK